MHIPDDPGFYEKYYFAPGDLGYKVFHTSAGRIGTLICWDQWYPEAARLTAMKGAEILVYPTAIGKLQEESEEEGRQFLDRSEEHTSELQSRGHLVCRLLPDTKY